MRSRSVALCIVLTVVTCGLYGLYWLYCLAEDMDRLTGGQSGGSGGTVLLLSIVTCGIYHLYWLYRCGDALDQLRRNQDERPGYLGILYLLLAFLCLGIISYALMQAELNSYADY